MTPAELEYGLNWLSEIAARQGARMTHEGDTLRVSLLDRDLLFRTAEIYPVIHEMRDLHWFRQRIVFREHEGRLVADCRGAQQCLMPWTGRPIWLPTIPEGVDFVAGYLQRHRPGAGDVVFDVGAYCGEMSLVLSALVGPEGRVIAFEPSAQNREYLQRNLTVAGVTNVTVLPYGLAKESGLLSFGPASGPNARLLSQPNDAPASAGSSVAVLTLEQACVMATCLPTFIKMDIEGAEVEVIESSLEFIRAQGFALAIASYHLREGMATARRLEELFRRIGYDVDTGYSAHLTTWAAPHLPPAMGAAGRIRLEPVGPGIPVTE